jgi:hypothetical protein
VLALLSGAGGFGGSSFSNSGRSHSYAGGGTVDSMLANAIGGIDSYMLGMGALLLAIVAIAILFAIAMSVLDQAVWFYVYEHFYCLLTKTKPSPVWKMRLKRHSLKAAVIMAFWVATFILFMAMPIAIAIAFPAMFTYNTTADVSPFIASIMSFLPLIALFGAFMLLFAFLQFLLVLLWVYYAMDNLTFFESMGRAFSLASKNILTFAKLAAIFILFAIAAVAVVVSTCCFAFITGPILQIFLTLLWGVTLMSLKLKLDSKKSVISPAKAAKDK